jgi:glycosyltransferase involved in cell wall biosynthesis
MTKPKLTAVIPCLNEAITLKSVVEGIRCIEPDALIVVVDNGSSDGTSDLAQELSCLVIKQPNSGKGNAFRIAISHLNSDIFFMVDGDDTYGLENLSTAIQMVASGENDMVIGKRIAVSPLVKSRNGHNLGNELFTRVTRTFFHEDISDSLSGYRVMSSGFVKSFQGGNSKFELEVELNTHARIIGCNVGTVTSKVSGRPEGSTSKLSTLPDGFRIILRLIQLFKNERPLLSFSILATPWFALSAFSIWKVLQTFFQTKEIANFPTLIGGVASFIVGVNLWAAGILISRIQLLRREAVVSVYRQNQSTFLQRNFTNEE